MAKSNGKLTKADILVTPVPTVDDPSGSGAEPQVLGLKGSLAQSLDFLQDKVLSKEDVLTLRALDAEVGRADAIRLLAESSIRAANLELKNARERLQAFINEVDARIGSSLALGQYVDMNTGKLGDIPKLGSPLPQ